MSTKRKTSGPAFWLIVALLLPMMYVGSFVVTVRFGSGLPRSLRSLAIVVYAPLFRVAQDGPQPFRNALRMAVGWSLEDPQPLPLITR
jgi:hypothetical protein